jgi:cell wall-associated NlpC family hydrolase
MKTRAEAVVIARSWVGTPYVLGGRIKGAGADCASLLAEYLIEIGAAERQALGLYSHDWFHHTTEERYKFALLKHAKQLAETVAFGRPDAQPGDLVLFKVCKSRVYNHGAIVTKWPMGVHAFDVRVLEVNLVTHAVTGNSQMAIFTPWSDADDGKR